MAKYGIPYMGSKGKIADWLTQQFPPTENFYDIFGGGFSITHAMLVRRKNDFKQFHFNETRPGVCDLIKMAIQGEYSYHKFLPSFVSREEFYEKKDMNPYIKICWSFGNNGKGYLFSKEIEPYKKSMHNAIVFNQFDALARKTFGCNQFADGYDVQSRRWFLRQKIEYYRIHGIPDFLLPFIDESKREAEHQRQLERLQQLQQVSFTSLSYEKIKILPNSVVYCDPPYAGTAEYDQEFDTKAFLDWADSQTSPVYISEYNISDPRFRLMASKNKRSLLISAGKLKSERVYGNMAAQKAVKLESPGIRL